MVEGSCQFSVGGSCGIEFLGPFVEFALFVGEVLLKHGDPLLKLIDVDRCSEAGLSPDAFPKVLGQSLLQLPNARRQARVARQGVGEIGLQ